jgi:hypothetical protein
MFDHLLGVVLLGLGISANPSMPAVKGESTEVEVTVTPTETLTPTPTWRPMDERDPRKTETNVTAQEEKERKAADARRIQNYYKMYSEKRKTFEKSVSTKREEAKAELTEKKEAFQEKLSEFKDERKQQVLTYINDKLTTLNKNRTDKMTEQLKKMSEVIEKMRTRTDAAKAEGKDVSSVDTALTAAETALSSAQAAVTAQAGKTYTITITTEDKAKTDAISAMKTLEGDLKGVFAQVTIARQSLAKAISALAQVTGKTEPTVTPGGTP